MKSLLDRNRVIFGDNIAVLPQLPDGAVQLIYIDPPFNTGKQQSRVQLRTERDPEGDRTGFQGKRYRSIRIGQKEFADSLADSGTLYFHIDYREVHYCKILLDEIFGRECFLNEIIWAYDYGARTKKKWPAKHDNILVYVKDPKAYYFDAEAVNRIPYMAPGLVGEEKAARGKLPTDTWWHTIVSPNGKEKTGYPTQKPLGILRRILQASSRPADVVLDFFAGSGTTGAAALELGRRFLLVDNNPQAIEVMKARFADTDVTFEAVE